MSYQTRGMAAAFALAFLLLDSPSAHAQFGGGGIGVGGGGRIVTPGVGNLGGGGGIGIGGGVGIAGFPAGGVPGVGVGGGVGLLGMPNPGIGGAGGIGIRPAQRPVPRLTTPTASAKPAQVDRELVFAVAADATILKLQASASGLNNVAARFDEIQAGQRLSVSPAKKGEKAEELTGTVLVVNAAERLLTLKVAVPADQPAGDGKPAPAQTVKIRSTK